ncbi:MAG: hypothetical protein H7A46_08995 [Verrucomicrobiales bacterium]|nr:hypothetical protein [Verrucomicrobiales bacterium]
MQIHLNAWRAAAILAVAGGLVSSCANRERVARPETIRWHEEDLAGWTLSLHVPAGLPAYRLRDDGTAPSWIGDERCQATPLFRWEIDGDGRLCLYSEQEVVAVLSLIRCEGTKAIVWDGVQNSIQRYDRTRNVPSKSK